MKIQVRRRVRLVGILGLIWGSSVFWASPAQQLTSSQGGAYTFTGKSWRIPSDGMGLSGRGFEAGARSDWHTHGAAQLLFVQEGRMRYQVRGGTLAEVGLHGTAYLPGGVPHWHGAAPDQPLTQVSVTFGPGITWMEKVSDSEYSANALGR